MALRWPKIALDLGSTGFGQRIPVATIMFGRQATTRSNLHNLDFGRR